MLLLARLRDEMYISRKSPLSILALLRLLPDRTCIDIGVDKSVASLSLRRRISILIAESEEVSDRLRPSARSRSNILSTRLKSVSQGALTVCL